MSAKKHKTPRVVQLIASCAAGLLVLAGCAGPAQADQAQIVVTTNILGDVVTQIAGDQAEVTVLMQANADPHSFGISAQQAAKMQQADLIVSNGAGLEEGLATNLEQASAADTTLFEAMDHLEPLDYAAQADHQGADPHFWTDPQRMDQVVQALGQELENLPGINTELLEQSVTEYRGELTALDLALAEDFAQIDEQKRALVTNHHVFGYLADRYDFRLIGAVIPGGSTLASPSAADLRELTDAIESSGVRAIFAETSQPEKLIQALASEAGTQVSVQTLFTESLSEPGQGAGTYLEMMRTNAQRITDGLSN